ncbi:MAG: hypothetical protein Q7K44_04835 [Candidatus Liptonbacteria bacterium]|nr:hypothetical protein [Candidatus Liptonbacteria bacterium]
MIFLDLQNKLLKEKGKKIVESSKKSRQDYGQNHHKGRKPDSFLPGRPVNVAEFLPRFLKKCFNTPEHRFHKDNRKSGKNQIFYKKREVVP